AFAGEDMSPAHENKKTSYRWIPAEPYTVNYYFGCCSDDDDNNNNYGKTHPAVLRHKTEIALSKRNIAFDF
ncbi:hypothetical protein JOB18_018132, partial [Solea senegalensis]